MGKYLLILLMIFNISCDNSTATDNNLMKKPHHFSITRLSSINKFYTNYDKAFQVAKDKNKIVFIFFTTQYCRWCNKLRETTLTDSEIIRRLNSDFIVLLLDKNYSKYPSKYNIKAVPSIYLTDKNEEIFTEIVGYHKNPDDYIKWFKYINIELSH